MRELYHYQPWVERAHISVRSEVSDADVHEMDALLARAIMGEHVQVPRSGGYNFAVMARGCSLAVTVYRDGAAPGAVGLYSLGIAAGECCSTGIWRGLTHLSERLGVGRTSESPPPIPPPAPWCAFRPDITLAGTEPDEAELRQVAAWLHRFEAVLAWAWLDLMEREGWCVPGKGAWANVSHDALRAMGLQPSSP
jgi:hypothetical protein